MQPNIIHINSIRELYQLAVRLKQQVVDDKLIVIRGITKLKKAEFSEFNTIVAGSVDKPFIEWEFGNLMELKPETNPKNYLFSQEAVPFHWDGAFHQEPSILSFYCVSTASYKGETLFADTEAIFQFLTEHECQQLQQCKVTYQTDKLAHYGGKISQPVIARHPESHRSVLRFGEAVATQFNPVIRECETPEDEALLSKLDALLYDTSICYAHKWQAGDIVLADNLSLLHGRNAFDGDRVSARHMYRMQIR